MYKNLLYLLFTMLILTSCKGEKQVDKNYFVIKGNIEEVCDSLLTIYTNQQPFGFVDTIRVKDGEEFLKQISVDDSFLGSLHYKETDYPLFITRGDTVLIESLDSCTLKVYGTSEYLQYENFVNELEQLNDSILEIRNKFISQYIIEHPYQLASLYVFNKYLIETDSCDTKLVKETIDNLPGVIQDKFYLEEYATPLSRSSRSAIGNAALFFNLKNLKGQSRDLNYYKGKFLVINFWASWDSLSLKENKELLKLHAKMSKQKDFKMVGISLDIDTICYKETVKREKYNWEQLNDNQGFESSMADRYGVLSIPSYFVITKKGKIIYKTNNVDSLSLKVPVLYKEDNKN